MCFISNSTKSKVILIPETVTDLFLRYKKIAISEEEMLNCLSQSGYSIYIADHKTVHSQKENSTSVNEKENYDLYISISSDAVLNLKKASGKLVYYHKASKIAQLHSIKQEISEFFRQSGI